MKYLLDTHAFIWASATPDVLSVNAEAIIANSQNQIYLSLVSLWEMQIKIHTGKFKFPIPLSQVIMNQQHKNFIQILSIEPSHIYELDNLPLHHRDPFDRLLIAQSVAANLPLITDDTQIAKYPVQIVW